MEIAPGISVDQAVCHGTPVLTGTRMPVAIVVGSLGGGMTKEEVMAEYELTAEQIDAALLYATQLVEEVEVIALAGA